MCMSMKNRKDWAKLYSSVVQIKIKKSEFRNVDFNLNIWYNQIFLTNQLKNWLIGNSITYKEITLWSFKNTSLSSTSPNVKENYYY